MHKDEFDKKIANFLSSKIWALGKREDPATTQELESYEVSKGICLPEEFKHVLRTYGAGDIGLVSLFSVRAGRKSIEAQKRLAHRMLPEFLPISDNGCGDYYGFLSVEGICRAEIYFSDHETGFSVEPTKFKDLYEYLACNGLSAD